MIKERYSFSKLSTFENCRFGFHRRYVEKDEGIDNCFSSYGTLIHSIMERYAKGNLELWDLSTIYEKEFNKAVPEEFPKSEFCKDMKALYYQQGLDFLKCFKGYQNMNILEVESEFEHDVDDWVLNGVKDLLFEDKTTHELVLRDYKSKAKFKNKKEQAKYARQLLLYCPSIKQKHGKYPDRLEFLMVRKQNYISIPFKQENVNEAFNWARNTVKEIHECFDFCPTCDPFFGNNLCNFRDDCRYRVEPN